MDEFYERRDEEHRDNALNLIITAHAHQLALLFDRSANQVEGLLHSCWRKCCALLRSAFSSKERYDAFSSACKSIEFAASKLTMIHTEFIPARELDDIELIIFDIDGTIAKWNDPVISPEAALFLSKYGMRFKFDVATNQGGPACRDAFQSERYPSYETVMQRLNIIQQTFNRAGGMPAIFVCWAWTRKDGSESFIPDALLKDGEKDGEDKAAIVAAEAARRKPSGAMLIEAMKYHGVVGDKTLFVGDRDSDKQAAENAGVKFWKIKMN